MAIKKSEGKSIVPDAVPDSANKETNAATKTNVPAKNHTPPKSKTAKEYPDY